MQPEQARMLWLGAALAPYLGLAAADAWMHEKARQVPRIEQLLHLNIAISLTLFFAGAFSDRDTVANAGLVAFALFYACDEFGFHGAIARSERRVHAAATIALLFFVIVWRIVEAAR